MTLSYGPRLFCLLTVVAGLVYTLVRVALFCAARFLLRRLQSARPRLRERVLYVLQIVPALLAIFIAGALCLPEYLRHEPTRNAERVGWITLLLVATVCIWFGSVFLRALRITLRTLSFSRTCRIIGRIVDLGGDLPFLALAEPLPPLGLVGFFRPFVIVSENLLEPGNLESGSLQVALDHERAHARQFDNWKLLSLCFLPRLPGDSWRRHWQAAADWAADDDAGCGDPARRLLLADALVRTARLAKPSPSHVICAALTGAESDLSVRIVRLLCPGQHSPSDLNSLLPGLAGVALLTVCAVACASPWVYTACEQILHLGGL